MDFDIKNSDSYVVFCKKLLDFKKPLENSIYSIYNPFGVRLNRRLRLIYGHLQEHKFRHKFGDTVNSLC